MSDLNGDDECYDDIDDVEINVLKEFVETLLELRKIKKFYLSLKNFREALHLESLINNRL